MHEGELGEARESGSLVLKVFCLQRGERQRKMPIVVIQFEDNIEFLSNYLCAFFKKCKTKFSKIAGKITFHQGTQTVLFCLCIQMFGMLRIQGAV